MIMILSEGERSDGTTTTIPSEGKTGGGRMTLMKIEGGRSGVSGSGGIGAEALVATRGGVVTSMRIARGEIITPMTIGGAKREVMSGSIGAEAETATIDGSGGETTTMSVMIERGGTRMTDITKTRLLRMAGADGLCPLFLGLDIVIVPKDGISTIP
jgi:hypothetical protein